MTDFDLHWASEHGIELAADDLPTPPPMLEIEVQLVPIFVQLRPRPWWNWPNLFAWTMQLPCGYAKSGVTTTRQGAQRVIRRLVDTHMHDCHGAES